MITDVTAMVVMTILFLVAYAWVSLFAKLLRGNEILAFEPRRETPWGFTAVVLSFSFLIFSQVAVGGMVGVAPDAEPTIAQTGALLTWTAVAILAATLASIGLIHLRAGAALTDFGISLEHIPRDLFAGIYAFLILGPITFAIQFVFVYLLELESHHPLIELLKQDSTGRLFGVVTLLAVIVAPISEEYFFRVLLQGWLERLLLLRSEFGQEIEPDAPTDVAPSSDDATHGSVAATPACESAPERLSLPSLELERGFIASAVPVVLSAALFALMHWSHGPDPVALFVLALGLGYLYQRTHRWLPCVVTHACLNGTTMLLLWLGLDELPP